MSATCVLLVPEPAAAHPVDLVLEAESFPSRVGGRLFSDARASGGAAWGLDEGGNSLSTTWAADHPGTYEITLVARGAMSDGVYPNMTLFVDGRAIGHWQVNATYARYTASDTLSQDTHRLTIVLTNPSLGAPKRLLLVDRAQVFLSLVLQQTDPLPTWHEAEAFDALPSGAAFGDVSASGGRAWWLPPGATASTTFSVSGGGAQYLDVTVWARADPGPGAVGKMVLRVNGAIVHSWYEVDDGHTWGAYSARVALFRGNHTLAITFTNDVHNATPDRRLQLDAVRLAEVAPERPLGPAVRHEAERFPLHRGWGFSQRDPTASNGLRWKQAGNGTILMEYAPSTPGFVTFHVVAKGEPALDRWPEMKLRIDDVTHKRWIVSTWLYQTFTHRVYMDRGTHLLEIASHTSHRSPSENRTLYVDHVDVVAEGNPLPTPTPLTGSSDWWMPGRDVHGSRANLQEDKIDRTNAGQLAPAWNFRTPRAVTGSPVLKNDLVYFADWGGTVYCVKADTGELAWSRNLEHGFIANTPLVVDGRVFVGTSHGELAALDAANGAVLWVTPLDDFEATRGYASPLYHDEKLYMGVSSDQESAFFRKTPDFRGSLVRIDADTGKIDWRFYTVEPNHTGGAMWSVPALDPETMTVYYVTGNAYTEPAHHRTNAIVALDARDGSFRWSYQALPDDVWTAHNPDGPDADFGMPVRIWRDPDGRKLVGSGNKMGDFFALDAATGALVYEVNPILFGEGFLGAGATAYGRHYATLVSDGRLVSMDLATGKLHWASTLSDRAFAGVAVAGGVVFTGTLDGHAWAIDAGNGAILWRSLIPDTAAPAVWAAPTVAGGTLLVPYVQYTYGWGAGGVAAFRPAA